MILPPPLLPRPHAHSLPSRAFVSACLLRVLKKHVPFPQCGALALNLHIRNDTVVRLLLRALCFKDASMLTFVLVAHGTVGCWTSLRSVTWQQSPGCLQLASPPPSPEQRHTVHVSPTEGLRSFLWSLCLGGGLLCCLVHTCLMSLITPSFFPDRLTDI